MAQLKLLVFDCDGTLTDSGAAAARAMQAALAVRGLTATATDICNLIGLPSEVMVARLFPKLSAGDCRDIAEQYVFNLQAARAEGIVEPLFEGIEPGLASLAAAGFRLGIATGKGRPGLDWVLDNHVLHARFSTLQTADVSPGKPDPTMLRLAMADVGCGPAETLMIGDTTHDADFARNASVPFLGVAWGFHTKADLLAAGAVAVVDWPSDLASSVRALVSVS